MNILFEEITINTVSIKLPSINIFQQSKLNSSLMWSEHYGAIKILESYCKKKIIIKKPYQYFGWIHGTHGPWRLKNPGLLLYNFEDKVFKYLVATKDEENYLKNYGYKNTYAVGMPILYIPTINLNRISNSLLIMPSHTLKGHKIEDESQFRRYVNYIKTYLYKFSHVAVCLHYGCIENGYWINEFSEIGVQVIEGARIDDSNALIRQAALFTQFEFVTTNNWGSHVAYALFFGCKVSISGPYPSLSFEQLLKADGTHQKNPENLKMLLSEELNLEKDKFLQDLYVEPDKAVSNKSKGEYLVGFINKKEPSKLYKIIRPTLYSIFKYYLKVIRNKILKNLKESTSHGR